MGALGTNRALSRLRQFYNWAILAGYIEYTPFKKHGATLIKLDRTAESHRTRRLQPGEEQALLYSAGPHLRAIITAALDLGCRKGELLSMQWQQVSVERNEIIITAQKAKTHTARVVPLSSRVRAVLEMRRTRPDGQEFGPNDYVFGNEVGEQAHNIRTAWEHTLRRANITGLHFHDLRRECGSRLLEAGASAADVRDWLGHTDLVTTNRYLATSSRRLQQFAGLLGADTSQDAPPAHTERTSAPTVN